MNNLKSYSVVLEQRDITIRRATINIKARTEEDAKVLARYREIRSWEWNIDGEQEEKRDSIVTSVSEAVLDPAPGVEVAPVVVAAPGSDPSDMPF